jgi:hypothetical protein
VFDVGHSLFSEVPSQAVRAGGTPFAAIIRRRCGCLDCGQVRIDKEYA